MAGKHDSLQENLRFIVSDIGDQLLPLFNVEDRLRGLPLTDLLQYIDRQQEEDNLTDDEREMAEQILQRLRLLPSSNVEDRLRGLPLTDLLQYIDRQQEEDSLTDNEREMIKQVLRRLEA